MLAPDPFFDVVARFPPYNEHLFHDLGAFHLGIAAALVAGLAGRPGLGVALWAGTVGASAHAISHRVDADLGGRDSDRAWLYNVCDDDPAPSREWLPVHADPLGAPQPWRVPRMAGAVGGWPVPRGPSNPDACGVECKGHPAHLAEAEPPLATALAPPAPSPANPCPSVDGCADLSGTRRPRQSAAMTIEAVAGASGTTRQTIYNQLGGRGALLLAVAADSQQRSGFDRLVAELAGPDAVDVMRGALREGVRIYAAEADVIRGIYAAAQDHTDVAAALTDIEQQRLHAQRVTIERLRGLGALATGWTDKQVENALMVTTSFAAFDIFRGLGMQTAEIATVLLRLCDALLVPDAR